MDTLGSFMNNNKQKKNLKKKKNSFLNYFQFFIISFSIYCRRTEMPESKVFRLTEKTLRLFRSCSQWLWTDKVILNELYPFGTWYQRKIWGIECVGLNEWERRVTRNIKAWISYFFIEIFFDIFFYKIHMLVCVNILCLVPLFFSISCFYQWICNE